MMDRISSFTLILILLFFALPIVAHPTSAIEIEEVNGLEIQNKILANFEDNYVGILFGTKNMTAKKTSEISYSEPYSMNITYTKLPCEESWNQSFGFELPISLRDISNYSVLSIRVNGSCSISAMLGTGDSKGCVYLGTRSSIEPDTWKQLVWDLHAHDVDLSNATCITFLLEDETGVTRTFFLDDIELTKMKIPQTGVLANFEDNYVDIWFGTKNMTTKKTSETSYSEPYSMNITYTKLPCEEGWQDFSFDFPPSSLNLSDYSAISIRVRGACSISAWLGTSDSVDPTYLGLQSSTEPNAWCQLIWNLTVTDVNRSNLTCIAFVMDDEIGATRTFFLDDIELTTAAIYVPDDYPTIQDAVNAASDGDTIIVRDGTYIENVEVYKRLTIQSENGRDNCIVQVVNSNDHVFEVRENYVNIRGFTVEGANRTVGSAGIYLGGVSHCHISNNKASKNDFGIHLDGSSSNMLTNNLANNNNFHGIYLYDSSNNSLIINTVHNNTCSGFYLGDSSNNSLGNNIVYNNTHNGFYLTNSCSNSLTKNTVYNTIYNGFYLTNSSSNSLMNNLAKNNSDGITLDNSSNTTLTNNTLSNNTYSGIWLKDTSSSNLLMNNNAKNNLDGVVLISSSNNSLMNNTVYNNTCSGFYLGDSSNNSLGNNTVYNNTHNGFYLTNSSSNSLTKNTVYNNIYNGFYLNNSSNNLLMNNNVKNNLNGIVLIYSNNNLIYHNNYIDNDNQSYDEAGTNLWNSSYPTGGNYWNDYNDNDAYSGPDQNLPGSDGIGDTPYNISGDAGAQDRYPFLNESGWLTGLTTITISPSTKTLYVGEKQWFTATAKDQNGDPVSGVIITWESSDTAVGIVCETSTTTDSDGKATTNFMTSATGPTTVKATSGTVSETASVTVQRKVVAGGGGGGGGSVRQQTPTATPTLSPSISEIVSRELEKLSRGLILFNVPGNMTVDKKERIEVRITKNFTENLTEGLKGRGIPHVEEIMVNTFMKVDLTGNNFDIEPLSPEDQIVGIEGFTPWEWDVIPLEPGIQVLHFLVTVRIRISDHPPLDKAHLVWDRYINVKSELEKVTTPVWDNDDKPKTEAGKTPVWDNDDKPEPENGKTPRLPWWLWVVAVIIVVIIVILCSERIKFVLEKFVSWIKEQLEVPVWLKPLLYLVWICVLISTFLSLIILLLNFDHEWVWKSLLIISIPLSFIAGASNKLSDPPSILGMMPFITILSIIGISGLEDLHITRLVITMLVICWCIIIYKYSPWLLGIIRKRYLFSIDIDAQLEGELNEGIISERLKNEFKTKKGIRLTENANLRKEIDNKRWVITDGEEIYILKRDKKEDKKLNIYR